MYKGCIKGFIFDFDGTIILSEHVHMRAWEDLANSVKLRIPDGFLEQSVGMSDHQLIKILCDAWNGQLSEKEILQRKRKFYMQRVPDECKPVEGVVDIIHWLKDKNFPLAIATSSSHEEVEPVLESLRISGHFSAIVTVDDVSRPKPDPEIYRKAAQILGIKPEMCMAFEDSKAGVQSARAAGCILVTLQTLYDEAILGPALISIRDFKDDRLRGLILNLIP